MKTVIYTADDKKAGMTPAEVLQALTNATSIQRAVVSFRGKLLRIEVTE